MILASLRHTIRAFLHRLAIRRDDWRTRTLWTLDLETGGLDPATDPIISVGMVPLRGGVIHLEDALRALVQPDRAVGDESRKVHQILPRDLDQARPAADVLPEVADHLRDGVLIVHQRRVDVPFLQHAFDELRIDRPVFAVIDTVDLVLRYARRHGHLTPERTTFPTALGDARQRFGLPPHRAHEALSDAVATAELFLVLAHRLRATRLGQLL